MILILRSDRHHFYWDKKNGWVLRKAPEGQTFEVIGNSESQIGAVEIALEWM